MGVKMTNGEWSNGIRMNQSIKQFKSTMNRLD